MFETFNLHPKLLSAINDLKWTAPTDVQAESLPLALAGKDLLVSAETGSGKTGAYLLPCLNRLMSEPKPNSGTRVLVLVPTRELAHQVNKDCDALTKYTGIKTVVIRGGQEFQYQSSLLRRNPEVVIATPGRLTEHLQKGTADLSDVECVILDECDRMLDMGFREEVLAITQYCTGQHQSLLLSATMKHKGVSQVAKSILNEPASVKIKAEMLQENITQQIIFSDEAKHKEKQVLWLLQNESFEKALIFTKTRVQAEQLANVLRYNKLRVASLHGDVEQDARNRIMAKYREGAVDVVVATDLAARGLDVDGVDLVINFDMAQSGDEHVHRVGRTGRAGQKGLAISLINSFDYSLMSSIERYLKIKFERRTIEALKSRYNGPKQVKANGKPAGVKKPKTSKKPEQKPARKKTRQADKKNVGKRRVPKAAQSNPATELQNGGFGSIRKKPRSAPED